MEHAVWLAKLRELGVLDGSVALVRAFLKERTMTIKIGGVKATPQGCGLGCLLYCVTTQFLTTGLAANDESHGRARGAGLTDEDKGAFLYVDNTTLFDVARVNHTIKNFMTNKTVANF